MAIADRGKSNASSGKRAAKGQAPKSTQVVALDRRREVEVLYQTGAAVDDIVAKLSARFPSANKRNVESDIHLIRKRWKEQVRAVFEDDVRSWFVFTALADRARAIEAGDLKLAYSIARDLAKLAGVSLSDLVVDVSQKGEAESRVMTWFDLMQAERQRKQLPPADFRVVADG